MSWFRTVTDSFTSPRSVSTRGASELDAELALLLEDTVQLAIEAAPLPPGDIEEDIVKVATSAVNAVFHQRAVQVSNEAFTEKAASDMAAQQQTVADETAARLEQETGPVEADADIQKGREKQAEAEIDVQRERIATLPLIERVKTHWLAALVALGATSAGVGTLARLSLEGVSDATARNLVTVAAVGGAFAAELVLGTFGAEAYSRVPEDRRRRILFVVMALIVLVLVATEILAAKARQAGVEATNHLSINPTTGQPSFTGQLTPPLIWTAPLAMLVTLSGAGVVGLTRLRQASAPLRAQLSDAGRRLAEARAALRDDEDRVKSLHERATQSSERAATLRGQAEASNGRSEHLVASLERISQQHAAMTERIAAEAILRYRIAAQQLAQTGTEPRMPAPRRRRAFPAALGALGAAGGVATSLFDPAIGVGVLVGSLILLASNQMGA